MTVNSFIDEFSEYLESVILSNDLLCLTGDFNDFGKFFAQKIADIRSDIRSVNTNQICLPINATSTVTAFLFFRI